MIKIVNGEKEILELERLRLKCIGSNRNNELDNPNKTFMGNKLLNNEYIGLAYMKDKQMIAGCIISDASNSIFIEWIFTDHDYRKKGIATNMLKYIEKNKKIFNRYYSYDFSKIMLEPLDKTIEFYKTNGYRFGSGNQYMRKNISMKS